VKRLHDLVELRARRLKPLEVAVAEAGARTGARAEALIERFHDLAPSSVATVQLQT
jgi:hypothetical protein